MIYDQIQQDSNAALKSSDKTTLLALRGLIAAIKYKEIDAHKTLSDEDCIEIIRKQISQLSEGVAQFEKANRQDLVGEYRLQIEIFSKYLPAEISDEELKSKIEEILSENPDLVKSKPQAILGIAVAKLKSQASSTRIVEITKKLLNL